MGRPAGASIGAGRPGTGCQRPKCGWPLVAQVGVLAPWGCSGRGGATCLAGSGFAPAVGLAVGDHDGGVVQERAEEADGGGVLGWEPAPGLEGSVAGDAKGAAFVDGGDEPSRLPAVLGGAAVVVMIRSLRCRVSMTLLTLLSLSPR